MMIHIDADDQVREFTLKGDSGPAFRLGTIGIRSYVNSMELQITPGNNNVSFHMGNYCAIGYNVTVLLNRNHDYVSVANNIGAEKRGLAQHGEVLIGHDVWVGNNVTILSGNRIGNGAVIGAGAVVSRDIPSYAIAVGNPVRIMKYRFSEEQINKLLKIKWWEWDCDMVEQRRDYFSTDIDAFIERFDGSDYEIPRQDVNVNTESSLFYPDFDDPYPIWPKVLEEYQDRYCRFDEATLILRLEQSRDLEKELRKISSFLNGKKDYPDILVFCDALKDERSLFKRVKYYITSRSLNTPTHIQFADECNVEILSGVDVPIFCLQ